MGTSKPSLEQKQPIADGKFILTSRESFNKRHSVWLADQMEGPERVRSVIAKFYHDATESGESSAQSRAQRERRYCMRIDCDQVPTFIESGSYGDMPYNIFAHVEAKRLHDYLHQLKPCNIRPHIDEVVTFFASLCQVLDRCHKQGFVHCDVKPENIFIRSTPCLPFRVSGAILFDFDAAVPIEVDRPERVYMTTHYASPEQLAGGTIDARADLWAALVILAEMLGAHPLRKARNQAPFSEKEVLSLYSPDSRRRSPDKPLMSVQLPTNRTYLHDSLSPVFGTGFSGDINKRYPNAEALNLAVQTALAPHLPLPGHATSFVPKLPSIPPPRNSTPALPASQETEIDTPAGLPRKWPIRQVAVGGTSIVVAGIVGATLMRTCGTPLPNSGQLSSAGTTATSVTAPMSDASVPSNTTTTSTPPAQTTSTTQNSPTLPTTSSTKVAQVPASVPKPIHTMGGELNKATLDATAKSLPTPPSSISSSTHSPPPPPTPSVAPATTSFTRSDL